MNWLKSKPQIAREAAIKAGLPLYEVNRLAKAASHPGITRLGAEVLGSTGNRMLALDTQKAKTQLHLTTFEAEVYAASGGDKFAAYAAGQKLKNG